MDDGFHCYYTCVIPANKFIPFAQKYSSFIGFLGKFRQNDVGIIEVSFPEKVKKIILDEFSYGDDLAATLFMEKHNDKEGGKFLIYALSKYGSNITKTTLMLERLYDCTIEMAAKTDAVKLLCHRIKEDIKNGFGISYINELMEPFEDDFRS